MSTAAGSRGTTALRIVLIFNGVMTLLALPAVFLPTSWMDAFHRQLGLGPLPEGPIVQYLARTLSALYATFGSLTLVLVTDVKRYWPVVTWWGCAAVSLGALLFGIDTVAGMPPHWTWGEGPYLLCAGIAVLGLQKISLRSSRT